VPAQAAEGELGGSGERGAVGLSGTAGLSGAAGVEGVASAAGATGGAAGEDDRHARRRRQAGRGSLRLDDRLAAAERSAIEEALAASGGNRTRAAAALGISRKALYGKMRRLGLGPA
jgi:DNA-binding NtrC family response regulator